MDGLILVDKPKGVTSNQVSLWMKDLLKEKTGHCGTLDPNVSGVLPVLVGKAVKLQEFLQNHEKEYICAMQLEKIKSQKELEKVLESFEGKIYQKPPKISAVAKETRVRQIYKIKLIEILENLVLFSVYCQHGVYIRKLVEDVGKLLGQDTQMVELRRTSVNGFRESECHNMFEIKDKITQNRASDLLKTMEFAVQSLPKVEIIELKNFKVGKKIRAEELKNWKGHIIKGTAVAVFHSNKLAGIAKAIITEPQKQDKGYLLQPSKVFI